MSERNTMPRIDDYLMSNSANTSQFGKKGSVSSIGASQKKQLSAHDEALLAEFSVQYGNNYNKLDRELVQAQEKLTQANNKTFEAKQQRIKSAKIQKEARKGQSIRQKQIEKENDQVKAQIKELEKEIRLQTELLMFKNKKIE